MANLYGLDEGQEEHARKKRELDNQIGSELAKFGRVQWMDAGDWNMTLEMAQESWDMGGTCVRTFQATECHGRELDWVVQANSMPGVNLHIHEGQPHVGHTVLGHVLPRNTEWDLRQSLIRRNNSKGGRGTKDGE